MKKSLLVLLMILSSTFMLADITQIAEIQENHQAYLGQTVTVRGIITIGTGLLHSTQCKAYIQDDSGKGIQIFDYSNNTQYLDSFVRGYEVELTAEVDQYNSVTELTDPSNIIVHDNSGSLELPYTSLTYSQMQDFDIWEGAFTSFSGEMTEPPYNAGGGYNLNVRDNSGNTITGRLWESTGVNVSLLTTGVPVTLYGIIDSYNSSVQLVPAYQEDIQIDITAPVIENVTFSSETMDQISALNVPLADEEVVVKADVFVYSGSLEEVFLKYKTYDSEDISQVSMTNTSGNRYEVTLPSLESISSSSEYYEITIEAYDDENETETYNLKIEPKARGPIFTNISFSHNQATSEDTISINATVIPLDTPVATVSVSYTLNYESKEYSIDLESQGANDLFSLKIGAFKQGTIIYITEAYAIDDSGNEDVVNYYDFEDNVTCRIESQKHDAILRIPPKVYKYREDVVPITVFTQSGGKLIVRIYNSEGKLVKTYNQIAANSNYTTFEWNGRDDETKLVPIGMYICFVESISRETGKKKTDKAPIVIGDKL